MGIADQIDRPKPKPKPTISVGGQATPQAYQDYVNSLSNFNSQMENAGYLNSTQVGSQFNQSWAALQGGSNPWAPTTPTSPFNPGGGGSYGGGGTSYAAQRSTAQDIINQYQASIANGSIGDPYQRVLDAALSARQATMRQGKRFIGKQRKALGREVRRGQRDIKGETAALERYLRGMDNPYAGSRQGPSGQNIDTSTALLASQGATGGASMEAAIAEAQANAAAERGMYNDYMREMRGTANEAQRSRLTSARMSGNDAMRELRSNSTAARLALAQQLFGIRLGARQQFDQTNLQTQAQIAQAEQAARDAALQIALQYGLGVPTF